MSLWLRVVQVGCVVTMYVAATALVLYLLSVPVVPGVWVWPELAATLLGSLLVNRLVERVPRAWRVRVWMAAGVVVIMLLTKRILGGGLDPLSGWQVLVGAARDIQALVVTMLGLLVLWARGRDVLLLSHAQVATTFGRAVIGVLALALLNLVGDVPIFTRPMVAVLSGYVVILVTAGLLALALTNIAAAAEGGTRQRWAVSTVLPVALVVLAGVSGAALVSPALRGIVLGLIDGLLLVVSVLLLPFAALASLLVSWLRALFPGGIDMPTPPPGGANSPLPSVAPEALGFSFPPWLELVLRWLVLLVLVALVIVVLGWAVRRVQQRDQESEDQRSSVWSWGAFGEDLRGLLQGLLSPMQRRQAGLRAALARLHGNDPALRVRRAYVRLLLLGEARERGRASSQTPREYAPTAEQLVSQEQPNVALLTGFYEQARYGSAPTNEQAAAAEQALQEVEREVARSNSKGGEG